MSSASKTREEAAAFAQVFAADDAHGYDQANRWGTPDTDCSALVILAYKTAGVPLTCTYTGNMRPDMLAHGFRDVTGKIDLATGAGLQRGDVLLHEIKHTALYIGDGKIVNASGNEYGKATGGQPGDQTGREIAVVGYYNFPWQYVLRYYGKTGDEPPADALTSYTVQPGDTLTKISWTLGVNVVELARINGISNINLIFPGQVLKLPGAAEAAADLQRVSVELPVLSKGSSGASVKALQALLLNAGIDVGPCGADGDFGEATWVAVCDLQRARGLPVDGVASGPVWTSLTG